MSRLGKQIINIPNKVQVSFVDNLLAVKGPLGELSRNFSPEIKIEILDEGIKLSPLKEDKEILALWGTYAAHINNMILGVMEGFQKKLAIEGVGYRFALKDDSVALHVGFSHDLSLKIPAGLKCELEKNVLTIFGIDKELLGEFAAKIRQQKKTEPYKGKGIRYFDEVPRRKQGKKVVG